MKKKKTIFHLLNHDQTIKITEDNENNGFKYYIEHRKHKNIIYLFKDNNDENSNVKYGYCLKCSKFISRDSSNISKHQNSLHKTFVENLEEINNKIMKLLIEVNASSLTVEKKQFHDIFPQFCKSRKTYTDKLNALYELTKQNIQEYLSQIEYVNIYIDEWSRFGLNFVGIFCSSIEKDFLLACGIPDSIFRNALCLSEYIKKQISEFKINEKIHFCSTDCAPNIAKATINLELDWNPCCCHVINKAMEKALEKINSLKSIIKKINTITKSTKLKQFMLINNENFLTIPSFSETRWLSIGNMFKRLEEKKISISNFLLSPYNKYGIEINENEWTIINGLNEIINGINNEIKTLESNSKVGFFNSILSLCKIMNFYCNQFISYGYDDAAYILKKSIMNKLLKYKNWTLHMLVAAHLNPNILIDEVLPSELKEISDESISYILQRIPALCANQQKENKFGERIPNVEQNQYQLFKSIPYSGTVDIYEYWIVHSHDLPELFLISKKYFGLYPSSSCIERAFSMAKFVLDDKFAALNPDNAEKRIFLYINNDFIP